MGWDDAPTPHNCEGFRLRGPWRGPSGLTSALSRAVHAHGPRQAASSETPDPLGERHCRRCEYWEVGAAEGIVQESCGVRTASEP